MKYFTIAPPPTLAPYVRCFWVYEGEASKAEPYIYRGYADGCSELIFHYKGVYDLLVNGTAEKSFAAGIHAQTRTFSRSIIDEDFGIFGCYLYPYALPKLFSLPSTDFTDQMVDFSSVLGIEGRELEERMLTAPDVTERVAILSTFLESRLVQDHREEPRVFSSIAHIVQTRGLTSVTDLSSRYFFSHRQFERKFKEFAGFSPKLFTRIIRFQAALKEYGSAKSLTDIAYDCGYYDQSHFINDFKEFSGYNPKIYFSGKAEGSEYLEA
ncbi:MAG: AraC family transcriptional regulator [Saprospiraceae bacterium]|nr:AraC family transcriptional regulator [Pyrinomonadaceae bacterium]